MADIAPAPDLDAYFARIGYDGPREATLGVLQALHARHPAVIPFENLTPLMGDLVSLALDAVQAKLVAGGRGGYCYEHNGLFKAVLEALGFQVTPLAAEVLWGRPPDGPPRPLSHMLLRVDLPEGPHIADVGFGGAVMTAALRLESEAAQRTPHDPYRLLARGPDAYELQAALGDGWRPLYRFELMARTPADYDRMNAFSAADPASLFVGDLLAARTPPGRRLALLNTRFTVRRSGAPPTERVLASIDDLKAVLTEDFGVTLPAGIDRIRAKLGL